MVLYAWRVGIKKPGYAGSRYPVGKQGWVGFNITLHYETNVTGTFVAKRSAKKCTHVYRYPFSLFLFLFEM